jgi:TetR/AcrR family transcriptional repressor of nem operon
MLRRYRNRFRTKVSGATGALASPRRRLELYISLYQDALADGRLCPCGVLTGELLSLESDVRGEVRDFFDEQIAWVEAQLVEARTQGELRTACPARQLATSIFGMIEGGMLLARARNDEAVLAQAIAGSLSLVFE